MIRKIILAMPFCLMLIMGFTPGGNKPSASIHLINDSLLVTRYIREMQQAELGAGDLDGYNQQEIDSMLHEQRLDISLNQIAYSPDSTFRIFVFQEDFCGAYCNSNWFSHVYSSKPNQEIKSGMQFYPISNIYPMPDGKYLALQQHGARAFSACGESTESATLFRMVKDSLVAYSFIAGDSLADPRLDLTSSASDGEDSIGPYLRYTPSSKRLSYHHGERCRYNYDSSGSYTGYYEYEKGHYVLKHETVIYTKP